MKPLSEWTDAELRGRFLDAAIETRMFAVPAAEVLEELFRRERGRCADEVAMMVGNWSEDGQADDALAEAESRIRGLQ